jgi:putative membrane protein insertion efficiency factor
MARREGRRAALIVAFVVGALVAHDVIVSPRHAFGARATLGAISAYQAHISPHLRGFVVCRFRPTCSVYGYQSVEKYGLVVGGARTLWRIARCGPWTPLGTVDPP